MAITFHTNAPIYMQLEKEILHKILSGELQPGQRMESVRDLALHFAVNPNTVQRALGELEKKDLLYTERTSGRFVTKDEGVIIAARKEAAREIVDGFFRELESIGFSPAEAEALLNGEAQKEG